MMGISRGHRTSAFYSPTDNPLVKLAFEGGNALLQIEILMLSEIEKSLLPEFLKVIVDRYTTSENLIDMRFDLTWFFPDFSE